MATKPPQDVSVVLSRLDIGVKVFEGLSGIMSAANSAQGVVKLFSGESSDTEKLIGALQEMTTRLEAKIQQVVDVGNDAIKTSLWSKNREDLMNWASRIVVRARELASCQET